MKSFFALLVLSAAFFVGAAFGADACDDRCSPYQFCSGIPEHPACFYQLDLVERDTLTFATTDDHGLPWPLTNPRDAGQLIGHAPHCLNVVRDLRTKDLSNSTIDYLHFAHCEKLLMKVKDYIVSQKYFVPELVCTPILRFYGSQITGGSHHNHQSPSSVPTESNPTEKGDVYYNYNYDKPGETPTEKGDVYYNYNYENPSTPSPDTEKGDVYYNYNYDSYDDREREGVFKYIAGKSSNQDDLYGFLCGENLGYLLLKEHLAKGLTFDEKSYLRMWWAAEVIEFGALGIFCTCGREQAPQVIDQALGI